MSDKQFSIGIKISLTVALILIIAMIGVIVYVSKSKDTTASILDEYPDAGDILIQENIDVEEIENIV